MPLVRLEFHKEGRLKYISHLDLIRTMQRAVRRAGIPVEYTRGFNPHPRMSFSPALPVGVSSTGEYIDMALEQRVPEKELVERLNNSLPPDILFLKAVYIPENTPSLTSVINAALYSIQAYYNPQEGEAEKRIKNFFCDKYNFIEKKDKKGRIKKVDIMPLILEIKKIIAQGGRLELQVVLATGSKQNLKPTDLLKALQSKTGVELDNISVHRDKLLVLKGGNYYTPDQIID